ncbi:glycosyl hydrolase family 28 protein [uncultured Sunxiuqinia sp.]|uniref:rhamnogalacturonidase n=1 Tax=uncultured Sunxiuqinia sp. TaxID=1573825 RepID=UPI002AA7AFD9|nr:glycosyl hydrolase family 28 protein [uncultured Sunxiuqinia sp.]
MTYLMMLALILQLASCSTHEKKIAEQFPDGTEIPAWFSDTTKIDVKALGTQFVITDYGAIGDGETINTQAIQKTIDEAARSGGGVVVIPEGRFLTGAIFFKPNTHLHVSESAILFGSDDISNFPKKPSRMEGQSIDYFPAVVNAYNVDGFTITGKGTIDGNGLNYWKAFWQRRAENPDCTNLEVSRPRLVFIQHSNDVQLQDVKLHNSGFWTTHLYKCNRVKALDLHIYSPAKPIKAPSTDAIDIDACTDVLVNGCYMEVNDDAVALKGGKGPTADEDPDNGPNKNIIIQNCEFGFCHSAVTCGSESIHNRNIIVRDCTVDGPSRVLWLKNRPDTPQLYEYILVENVTGRAQRLIYAKPWTQFFDLKGHKTQPLSQANHITFRNIDLTCKIFADISVTEYDLLKNFTFDHVTITAENGELNKDLFDGLAINQLEVNGQLID